MNHLLRLEIPGAPVAKGRPRIGRGFGGRPQAFTPAKTVNYENLIKMCAAKQMNGAQPYDQPLRLVVTAYLPIPASWSQKKRTQSADGVVLPTSRPDVDNFLKAALDGMNGIVYRDDSLVTDVTAGKRYSEFPRLVIEVFA